MFESPRLERAKYLIYCYTQYKETVAQLLCRLPSCVKADLLNCAGSNPAKAFFFCRASGDHPAVMIVSIIERIIMCCA